MTATERAIQITQIAATAAADKKGHQIVALDVSEQLAITDVFLVVSARSERAVNAIIDAIEKTLIEQLDLRPARREGKQTSRWVLLDYLDVVVHVFHDEERQLYSLERLWKDCPTIELDVQEDPDATDDVDDEALPWGWTN